LANEFDLIEQYFSRPVPEHFLGVGDDCALLPVDAGRQLAVSTDLLLEGRHFFSDVDPASLGHKALAVNLSDLAAMGAEPLACLLSISLPGIDHAWLKAFSDSFHALAAASSCPLVGGDTTRSVSGIVLSVTVLGQVDPALALRRAAARPGDDIWITGRLGAADVALRLLQGRLPSDPALLGATRAALEWPQPPLVFAQRLPGLAHAALDISDGLLQDLRHILKASRCGAELDYGALPVHPALAPLDEGLRREAVLSGGDVYQLCFTADPRMRERIVELAAQTGTELARVGRIVSGQGLVLRDAGGQPIDALGGGYDHFG